ncbi:MAG: beta-galactosidase [Planctomycetes bacterium]|nr:beta-galactosidase [Planctomycetota bacterium]
MVASSLRLFILLCALAMGVMSAESSELMIADFTSPDDLAKITVESENCELTVGQREATDRNNVLKFVARKSGYPGFYFYPPKIPKDWSKYQTLSFVAWSTSDRTLAIRIDGDKSFDFNSRFNGSFNVPKGRTQFQIPIADIARKIDPSQIKMMVFFLVDPPLGTTLWFDDFKLGPKEGMKVDFIPYAERFDVISSMEVVTPHLPMARGLAGGPLKTFMLSNVRYGREVVEMMQRMDLDVSLMSWDSDWGANAWGLGDHMFKRGHSTDFVQMQKYLDSSMQGPERFDAMVMHTPLGWNRFTSSAREAILKRVREDGEGLVLVMPFPGDAGDWPADLREACALIDSSSDLVVNGCEVKAAKTGSISGKSWTKTKAHPITAGVPIETLPFASMETQSYKLAPGAEVLLALESGEPVLAVKQLGKGRVVTFATRAQSLTARMSAPMDYVKRHDHRYWETWYNLINRAIAWAGKREFTRKGDAIELAVTGEHRDRCYGVTQWKDAAGRITDWEMTYRLADPGLIRLTIAAPEAVARGAEIPVTFEPPSGVDGASWSATLCERSGDEWRTLEKVAVDAASGKISLSCSRVTQPICIVEIQGRTNERVLIRGRAEVVVTPDNSWDDYQTFSWFGDGLPFLVDVEMRRMRDLGLTGNTAMPKSFEAIRNGFRSGLLAHVLGITTGLHSQGLDQQMKAFNETKDPKHLIRSPSYGDDAFVAKEREQAAAIGAGLAPYAPLSMVLGDETALTMHSVDFDFDFHPGNVQHFRQHLKARFGDIAALNMAVAGAHTSFDQIVPPTSEEAKKSGNFGLWNEWRSHNDDMWAEAHGMYREALRSTFPGTRLSLSGTQSQLVFNGVDWAKLTPHLDAICGYRGRLQELHRLSFHPGNLRSTSWCGYGRSGRAVDHEVWSNLVNGGDGMGLFWWYCLRNPDLTFCRSGKDYARAIAEMRSGIGMQYMQARRAFSKVAMLWSANSQRASWSQGKMTEFVTAETLMFQALVASGLDPMMITEEEVAGGGLAKRGIRALVLPMSLSLGLGAKKGGVACVAALQRLLDDGGLVIASESPRFDEFLQPASFPDPFIKRLTSFGAIALPAGLSISPASGIITGIPSGAGTLPSIDAALAAAFAKSGAIPHVRVMDSAGSKIRAYLHAYEQGGARLLTLVREPIGSKEVVGDDGVSHSVPNAEGGKEIERLAVDVSGLGSAVFYDMRKRTRIPVDDGKIMVDLREGNGHPIAVLPHAIDAMTATATITDRWLSIQWRLKTAASPIAPHVVRVEVLDTATDAVLPHFSKNVLTGADATGTLRIPLSFEDQARTFVVRVCDIMSGQEAKASVSR